MIHVRLGGVLLAALLSLSAVGNARAADSLSDSSDGVTCQAFNAGAGGEWARRGGDWQDAAHQAFGSRPYSTTVVPANYQGRTIQLDLTALFKDWMTGRADLSKGMMVSAIKGGGILDVVSRESPEMASRPILTIEFADGSGDIAFPTADAYVDCSTVKGLGREMRVKLGGGARGVFGFALPQTVREKSVRRMTLSLTLGRQYGGEVTLGVFAVSPPVSPDATARPGLAAKYVDEESLGKDPDVYFQTGFESVAWASEWSFVDLRMAMSRVTEDLEGGFAPLKGHALKIRFKKGVNLGADIRYAFNGKQGREPEEAYFRYYLRFGSNWSPDVDGGKLPGFAGTYGKAGWGMRKSNGDNGWSLRGSFSVMAGRDNPLVGATPIGTYAYHADMAEPSGDGLKWGFGRLAALQRNRWYCVEQYVKLNTPGQKDGVMRAWIDGRLAFEKKDLRLRNVPELKIETVWFDIYHGGMTPPPRDMDLYIDNVVIAKSYIGPMRQPAAR
ncbi:MAG: hypothetical protein JSR69_07525 [Proteobacteria bacterium]|nr:hypothetical protein [Pseudomonadota bacterium]